jgi:hypothetical protein
MFNSLHCREGFFTLDVLGAAGEALLDRQGEAVRMAVRHDAIHAFTPPGLQCDSQTPHMLPNIQLGRIACKPAFPVEPYWPSMCCTFYHHNEPRRCMATVCLPPRLKRAHRGVLGYSSILRRCQFYGRFGKRVSFY